jgi:hypothetical protein
MYVNYYDRYVKSEYKIHIPSEEVLLGEIKEILGGRVE